MTHSTKEEKRRKRDVLPWSERVTQLSIHPEAATIRHVERLATELLDAQEKIEKQTKRIKELAYTVKWMGDRLSQMGKQHT